jgi:hypothetical protein
MRGKQQKWRGVRFREGGAYFNFRWGKEILHLIYKKKEKYYKYQRQKL